MIITTNSYFCNALAVTAPGNPLNPSYHGANKKEQSSLVAGISRSNSRIDLCHLQPLAMANNDTSFPDYSLCKGYGHNVVAALNYN